MKLFLLILISFAWIPFIPGEARGCTCIDYDEPVCSAFWRADSVFADQVLAKNQCQYRQMDAFKIISIPGIQVLLATQEVAHQGKPVPIALLGPKRWEQRTPFAPNSAVEDKFRLVVRDRATWLDVWKRIYQHIPSNGPYPELPEIDFSREMLVVAAMGQQPTSGYAIIIDGAYERDNLLEIVVKSVVTVKCFGVFTVVTAPLDIVRLPRTERAVVFREIEVVPECKFQ